MSEKGKTAAAKVSYDTYDRIQQYAKENGKTMSSVVKQAIDNYLAGNSDNSEILTEVEALKSENTLLKQQLSKKTSGNDEELQAEIERLTKVNKDLTLQIEELSNRPPEIKEVEKVKEVFTPPANAVVLKIPAALQPFLDECAVRETTRTGKKVTREMILLNLFWAQVSKGPGDHLPVNFSPREVSRILRQVKEQEKE